MTTTPLNGVNLDNGIVQGDPLSMILYLFYNMDILDVARGKNELCLGYVDDLALVAMAKNFTDTHRLLKNMISQDGGVREWSTSHNSRFKDSKSVLIDFSQAKGVERPSMNQAQRVHDLSASVTQIPRGNG